jgi:hypothetical protein
VAGGDLPRRALETLAAEEYKHDHDVWIEYTLEDAEREYQGLQRLGFRCGWLVADTSPVFYLLCIDQIEPLATVVAMHDPWSMRL